MAKETIADLIKFLDPYPEHVKVTALGLRAFVWDLYPQCNELIYDNYNALAIGWSPTDRAGDVFCSIALFSDYLNFGFNRGADIANRDGILKGDGNRYRYIRVKSKDDFPQEAMKQLLEATYDNAIKRMKSAKNLLKGETIVKSVSPVKKRPQQGN